MDAWIAKDKGHVADYPSGTTEKPGGTECFTSMPDTCLNIIDMEVSADAPPVALSLLAASDEAERLHDGFSDDGIDDDSDGDCDDWPVGDDLV